MFLRALLAFIALPGVVAFLIPLWIASGSQAAPGIAAFIALGAGLATLLWCVGSFYVSGKGTLAPWAPPRQLVTTGLYRFSRNPMYIGVLLVLAGWALLYQSSVLAGYAAAIAVGFHLRVLMGEEPWLAKTHGEAWSAYKRRVPRWLWQPRLPSGAGARDRAVMTAEIAALRAADFDEADPASDGMERLYKLCDELSAACSVAEAAPVLLALVERLDGAHLGSPGPVVHTLEKMRGYEPYLRASLLRKPTSLTVWMANRIANAHPPDKEDWVRLIEAVALDPRLPAEVREEASHFAKRQRGA